MKRYALIVLMFMLAMAGCVQSLPVSPTPTAATTAPEQANATPTQSAPAPSDSQLAGTSWALISFGPAGAPVAVLPDSTITLEFAADGQAGGHGGCNTYGGSYAVDDGELVFGEMISTLMACADADITEQETQYLAALATAGRFEVTADSLTIWYDDGSGVLNFAPASGTTPQATQTEQAPTVPEPPLPTVTAVPTATTVLTETAGSPGTAMHAGMTQPAATVSLTTEDLKLGVRAQGNDSASHRSPWRDEARRIRFEPGATSATIEASIDAQTMDSYVLHAQQGQIMSVEITSPNDDVLLSVVGEDGTPYKRYQVGGPHWASELPVTQDYYLHAVSVGPATPYTLRVWIEALDQEPAERVRFAPGATSANRTGSLRAGSIQAYVLAAAAGQRMHVQSVGYNAPVHFTVRGPNGAVWPGEQLGAGVYVFAREILLPATGDYVVTLSVPQGEAATRYDVVVTIDNAPTPTPVPTAPPQRVRFAPGAISAQRSGLLPTGPGDQAYVLAAVAGQRMTVEVNSDGSPLNFVIVGPDGSRWPVAAAPSGNGYRAVTSISLPQWGDYRVMLSKGQHTPSTNFVVTFTIE